MEYGTRMLSKMLLGREEWLDNNTPKKSEVNDTKPSKSKWGNQKPRENKKRKTEEASF